MSKSIPLARLCETLRTFVYLLTHAKSHTMCETLDNFLRARMLHGENDLVEPTESLCGYLQTNVSIDPNKYSVDAIKKFVGTEFFCCIRYLFVSTKKIGWRYPNDDSTNRSLRVQNVTHVVSISSITLKLVPSTSLNLKRAFG